MQHTIIKLLKTGFNPNNSTLNHQLSLSETLDQIDRLFVAIAF